MRSTLDAHQRDTGTCPVCRLCVRRMRREPDVFLCDGCARRLREDELYEDS
jgi:ribosomal protein L37AE/L43A